MKKGMIFLALMLALVAGRRLEGQGAEEEYRDRVKPVFQAKCFDCHSNRTRYPWYYKIPIVKWLIDDDIAEARDLIDMSNDFPFQGHGTPREDLQAIRRVVLKDQMPPFLYRLGHWDSKLTDDEKKTILDWAEKNLTTQ